MMKRLISLLLCIAMLAGMLTVTAVAAGTDTSKLFSGPIEFTSLFDCKREAYAFNDADPDDLGPRLMSANGGKISDAYAKDQMQKVVNFDYPFATLNPNKGKRVNAIIGVDEPVASNYYYTMEDLGSDGSDLKEITIKLRNKGTDLADPADDSDVAVLAKNAKVTAYGQDCFLLTAGGYGYFIGFKEPSYEFGKTNYETFRIGNILEVSSYKISYDLADGELGSGESNPRYYDVLSPSFDLPTPTRTGYTFDGWTGNNVATAQTRVTIASGSTGNLKYTANWTATEYPITYHLNGGSASNPGRYTIEDSDINLTNPSKLGYTFTGWTGTDLSGQSMTVTIPAGSIGDREYTATWSRDTYNITYVLGDDPTATNHANNPPTYTVDDTITLQNPSRLGYRFDGWYTNNTFSGSPVTQIVNGTTGAKTFYAKWTPIVYGIEYYLYDGTVDPANPTTYTIEEDSDIELTNPTKWGYTFLGWGESATDTTPELSVEIPKGSTGDREYHAIWSDHTLPEQLYPGESYILRSGLDRSQYKVSGFDFTSGRRGFNGASYIESIKIDKNGDLVMTMKENFNLALDTDKVIKGEITVVDKTTKPQTKHYVPVEGKINNDVKDIFGAKKAAEAEDINPYWGENAVLVMDEDGGYVSFSEEMLSGVVKMKKNEKAYLNLIYGVNDITEDTIDAIEEYLGEDYVDDAIIEYYTFETKAFKNEVDFSYEAYEEDPHYFYLWKNGKLKKIDVTYNDEEDVEAWQWTADAEGTIIVTDVEIVLAEENTKNPNTGR